MFQESFYFHSAILRPVSLQCFFVSFLVFPFVSLPDISRSLNQFICSSSSSCSSGKK
eukprot:m.4227 g.4227  ORF g.4227 m.4227 type:complete len:57 (+) comp5179_c0_seq1:77-247(+)